MVGFVDANLARCMDDGKSTTILIFKVIGGAISWKSTKQSLVATFTMEAKIIASFEGRAHAKWLRNFIFGLKVVNSISMLLRIFSNNSFIVSYAKSTKNTRGAKYIKLKYFKPKA